MRAWIASQTAFSSPGQDQLLLAWVALDAGDNDPLRFWISILTACQRWFPHHETTLHELLHTAQPQSMLTTFLHELSSLATRGVLVLEDYHMITSPRIHEMVVWLLAHLPATLHVIFITRVDPAFPLARLRANEELQEIRAVDLRFALTETQAFLQQALPFSLDAQTSARMHDYTEGWVTGLRLLTLALQACIPQQESEPLLASFRGSHRYILEYLVEDVLSAQPDEIQLFLLQTSGLSRLTASLCDAITERNDSDLLLAQVERANLFLQSLDGSQQWYRYHALWAQAMQREAYRRLGAATVRTLSAKASQWYEQQGLLPEAIEAALVGEEFPHAATLIERFLVPNSFHNPYHLLRGFMERLPKDILYVHPSLSFAYAEAVYFTSGRHDPSTRARLEEPLHRAEQGFRAQENWSQLAQLLSLNSVLTYYQRGDFVQPFALAHQALALQPAGEQHWRGTSLIMIAAEEMLVGKFDSARQKSLEARLLYEADAYLPGRLVATLVLGEICAGQGELRQAAHYYRQVLAGSQEEKEELFQQQLTSETGLRETLFEQMALGGLAALAYEWNELETAHQYLSQIPGGTQREELHYLTCGSLVQARLLHARGLTAQGQELLATLAAQARSPLFLREIRACQARLHLAVGDLLSAHHWLTSTFPEDRSFTHVLQEEEALLLVRLHIAQGEGEQALALLEPWKAEAQGGRTQTRHPGDPAP